MRLFFNDNHTKECISLMKQKDFGPRDETRYQSDLLTINLYKSRLHLTDSESWLSYAANIFFFAKGRLSSHVCLGVFP